MAFDGHAVNSTASLLGFVRATALGDKATLTIVRDGKTMDVDVTLDQQEDKVNGSNRTESNSQQEQNQNGQGDQNSQGDQNGQATPATVPMVPATVPTATATASRSACGKSHGVCCAASGMNSAPRQQQTPYGRRPATISNTCLA